jgi:opacity protein-like surface antigen
MRFAILLAVVLAAVSAASPAAAAVNVERHGAENPMVEISRSTLYGALAGLVVGGAIALAADDDSGEPVRWGIVAGTAIGLGVGIYFVTRRPQPDALLELNDGALELNAWSAIEASPTGVRVRFVGAKF